MLPTTFLNELLDIFRETLAQEQVPSTVKARVRAMFQTTERMLKEGESHAVQEKREQSPPSEGGQVVGQANVCQSGSSQASDPIAPGSGTRNEASQKVSTRRPFRGFSSPDDWKPLHCEYGGHDCWVPSDYIEEKNIIGRLIACPACWRAYQESQRAFGLCPEEHTDQSHSRGSISLEDTAVPRTGTSTHLQWEQIPLL